MPRKRTWMQENVLSKTDGPDRDNHQRGKSGNADQTKDPKMTDKAERDFWAQKFTIDANSPISTFNYLKPMGIGTIRILTHYFDVLNLCGIFNWVSFWKLQSEVQITNDAKSRVFGKTLLGLLFFLFIGQKLVRRLNFVLAQESGPQFTCELQAAHCRSWSELLEATSGATIGRTFWRLCQSKWVSPCVHKWSHRSCHLQSHTVENLAASRILWLCQV